MRIAFIAFGLLGSATAASAVTTDSSFSTSTAAFVDVVTFDGDVESWQNPDNAVMRTETAISSSKELFVGIGLQDDPTFRFGDIDVWSQVSVTYVGTPLFRSSLNTSLNLDPLFVQEQGWENVHLGAFNSAVIRDGGVFMSPGNSGEVRINFVFQGEGEHFLTAGRDTSAITPYATVDTLASSVRLDLSSTDANVSAIVSPFKQTLEAGEGRTDAGNINHVTKLFPDGQATLGERAPRDLGLGSGELRCVLNERCDWRIELRNTAKIEISTVDAASGNVLRTQAEYGSSFRLHEVQVLTLDGQVLPFTATSDLGIDYAGLTDPASPVVVPLPASMLSLLAGLSLLSVAGLSRSRRRGGPIAGVHSSSGFRL